MQVQSNLIFANTFQPGSDSPSAFLGLIYDMQFCKKDQARLLVLAADKPDSNGPIKK